MGLGGTTQSDDREGSGGDRGAEDSPVTHVLSFPVVRAPCGPVTLHTDAAPATYDTPSCDVRHTAIGVR
ncbi:hypothetical protein Sgleb_74480 [Streptomyces glebosus]|uniref:Uncharacterized protein n=1 Tax=Streptomyces glebosus TaxID=249580 RepID=A0A640TA89_9ACTN|nr:hypothetical protein Sgleb_74480 [Streptomyces glebosus]GHG62736.1 hypothetical protein GCM10010513_29690 [Streptomyces glebosus]